MPRSSCNACCNSGELARANDSFKDAVLQILCAILGATGGSTSDAGGTPASATSVGVGPSVAATGGNLTAGVVQNFTWTDTHFKARVVSLPTSPNVIYGKWNAANASPTDFDFYCSPGDVEQVPPGQLATSVSLYSTVNQTYNTHFSVRGY